MWNNRGVQTMPVPVLEDATVRQHGTVIKVKITLSSEGDVSEAMHRYAKLAAVVGGNVATLDTITGDVQKREVEQITCFCETNRLIICGLLSNCPPTRIITLRLSPLLAAFRMGAMEAIQFISEEPRWFLWHTNSKCSIGNISPNQARTLLNRGEWMVENLTGNGILIVMALGYRSWKEQLSVDALLGLARS
jgi:hypothetical protein